ncbi:nucleoside triphosphate pyrophosphohydrolase [Paraglaciecola arctica]|uniref:nucleoside triphosphate pyrophosphohydrolase n=1 Tax=Paraglaciecola arctica TaxID=1128911 RepID=UPI001C079661|nr:nucleoside triphosphate pyrophosphohydrolase [Paraglaciecola arctica]
MSEVEKSNQQISRLIKIMQQLRDPKTGCPWDQKQSFTSIVPHTIEETYEVVEAILSGNMLDVKDELGDLLFQIVFYAQLAQEQQQFDFEDIAQTISDKLVRRHPHVFQRDVKGEVKGAVKAVAIKSEEQLNQQWENIKQQERQASGKPIDDSTLANIPKGMTPLLRAQKIQKKCANVGFDWTELPPVVDKIHEEIQEVLAEINAPEPNQLAIEEEVGDLLFAVVNLARHSSVNAETALIKANRKFEKRFRKVEQEIDSQGMNMHDASLQQMEAAWQKIKKD